MAERDSDKPKRRTPGGVRLCDWPGCCEPARPGGRYCGDDCAKAMKNVLDREQRWRQRPSERGSRG